MKLIETVLWKALVEDTHAGGIHSCMHFNGSGVFWSSKLCFFELFFHHSTACKCKAG